MQQKERPILFSAPMVRAILEGRKTQTRRVVKGATSLPGAPQSFEAYEFEVDQTSCDCKMAFGFDGGEKYLQFKCPYGKPGDKLWVRETFSGPLSCKGIRPSEWPNDTPIWYDADEPFAHWDTTGNKPSIHMPRKFSRILLKITNVRVEKLQYVSEKDARSEGVPPNWCGDLVTEHGRWNPDTDGFLEQPKDLPHEDACYFCDGRTAFKSLWDSINGKRDHCSWDSNPWVWVVEFERC